MHRTCQRGWRVNEWRLGISMSIGPYPALILGVTLVPGSGWTGAWFPAVLVITALFRRSWLGPSATRQRGENPHAPTYGEGTTGCAECAS